MRIPYALLDFSGEVTNLYSQWDMTLIMDIIDAQDKVPNGHRYHEVYPGDTFVKHGIIIIPARQNAGFEEKINNYLSSLEWCVVMLVGDEERLFDTTKLQHPHMKLWLMQPKLNDQADFYLGSGYSPHLGENLPALYADYDEKPLDWFFSGQVNHDRREQAATVLKRMLNRDDLKGDLYLSEGFTQGIDHQIYDIRMAKSKAVPAPSGIQSPDSFRVYEALEVGAVPVADDLSTVLVHDRGYWSKVFNDEDVPFKVFSHYDDLEGYIADVHRNYPRYNNKVFGWWQQYKRRMATTLADHVNELSHIVDIKYSEVNKITVIVLTSPIASHPSTELITKTITDIRKVLPYAEIIIGIDGVRTEQEGYRARYEEYKKRLLWQCNMEWSNVTPIVFDEHMHQAAMTRSILKLVRTPTILFVEHDTALCPDFDYDWKNFVKAIESGEAYTIRFHFEAEIPEPHEYLMIGDVKTVCGLPMLRTAQWSQRPHLSSTVFYREMMERYFTDESRTMIEDKVHGFPAEAYQRDGLQGWYSWRIWIYHPEDNIKRSYTSDGRGDDPKYEMRF